jgi:hypothetical protein
MSFPIIPGKKISVTKQFAILFVFTFGVLSQAQSLQPDQNASAKHPVTVSIYDRTRVDAWQWFAAPPEQETYGYVESLLRLGVSQRIQHWDWQLEISQPAVLGLPETGLSAVSLRWDGQKPARRAVRVYRWTGNAPWECDDRLASGKPHHAPADRQFRVLQCPAQP